MTEFENTNTTNETAAPAVETPSTSSAAATAPSTSPVYDATARQTVAFEGFGDAEIEVDVDPITDEIYRKVVEPMNRQHIASDFTLLSNDLYKGHAALFDAVVTDFRGYPGEKPANWKERLDALKVKSPIIARLLTVACYNDAPSWDDTEEIIFADAYYGDEVVTCKHFLRKASADDVRKFNSFFKGPTIKGKKKLDSGAFTVSAMSVEKARLYDTLTVKPAEGYAGGIVPIWHKVAVIEHHFADAIKSKK